MNLGGVTQQRPTAVLGAEYDRPLALLNIAAADVEGGALGAPREVIRRMLQGSSRRRLGAVTVWSA
jgi:hypothetical protein